MKALIVTLMFPVLLKSCEGIPDQQGTPPPPPITTGGGNGGGSANNSSGTTDVPIDGGLSILLAAGAAYGVKRYRSSRKKNIN